MSLNLNLTDYTFQALYSDATFAKDRRRTVRKTHNRAFQTHCTGTAIQNVRNLRAKLLIDMCRRGRADVPKRVGTRRGEGEVELTKQLMCHRVGRNTNRYKGRASSDHIGHLF